MSRGFVKEEDQEEAPIIPPRAALPEGVTNYVTPNGMKELLAEKEELEKARADLEIENETEKRRVQAVIDGKMQLLAERIASARALDPKDQNQEEVRFGAKITYEVLGPGKKAENFIQIVGVDEADVKKNKIAFVAPLARAFTGKKEGETAEFQIGKELRKFKIKKIEY
ncbi:GreA/GreB family elongation factor [Salegentibacter chungangensis]|uniref:GreA/GreB family elongation factor n=1 Tax=Salegentibacter chungangensis TaxID=1335724 RepID=A0ABW3NT61_9FLAO